MAATCSAICGVYGAGAGVYGFYLASRMHRSRAFYDKKPMHEVLDATTCFVMAAAWPIMLPVNVALCYMTGAPFF